MLLSLSHSHALISLCVLGGAVDAADCVEDVLESGIQHLIEGNSHLPWHQSTQLDVLVRERERACVCLGGRVVDQNHTHILLVRDTHTLISVGLGSRPFISRLSTSALLLFISRIHTHALSTGLSLCDAVARLSGHSVHLSVLCERGSVSSRSFPAVVFHA